MNEPLSTTLIDAIAFLDLQGVPYALIGGLAASLRGQPRVTVDVDLVIIADLERALALIPALAQSQFAPLFDGVEEVVQKCFILPLRHRSTGVKVDIAIGLSGFERQAVGRARPMALAGAMVNVASAEDLIIMKILAARPQDDQDIRGMLIAQQDHLDWDYCQRVARDLGEALGQDLLSQLQSFRRSAGTEPTGAD